MVNLAAIRLRTAARKAARDRAWPAAVRAYRAYLDRRPRDVRAWVQYGHAAKETGDLHTAAAAYGCALAIDPGTAETWWHLSYVRGRLGDRIAAIDCCARAVALDPGFARAIDTLVALGARDRIAGAVSGDERAGVRKDALPFASALDPAARYDAFRQDVVIPSPPHGTLTAAGPITVLVDARPALPVEVRITLSSLLDQVADAWQAIVRAPPAIRDHPVASLAKIDPRVRFVAPDAPLPDVGDAPLVLLVGAGTVLDRQALAWFSFAAARTGCVAAYGDHDRSVEDWRTGRTFREPLFQPVFDPDWFGEPGHLPIALLIDRTRLDPAAWRQEDPGGFLRRAAAIGPIAHLPLLLASGRLLADEAERAPSDPPVPAPVPAIPPEPQTIVSVHRTQVDDRIQVVVQTRDQPGMLRAAIDAIRDRAARPDLLDITVVDNRSVEPATGRLLAAYVRQGVASVLSLDEPFNWSRANNLAVEGATAPLLLFLNNDTEMLTAGWDGLLRRTLAAEDVGVAGATLLYPDGTIQHAGIVMGMGRGGPIHEGVGRSVDAGPADRWRKPRSTAAVTGAFLAMRRDVFAAVEGFDAMRFAIAFNDVDLCLRVRAAGFRIVVAAGIQAIHHESKTRGANVTRSQVAWDFNELARLHDRWGAGMFDDLAYNPHWTRTGQPFDGYRLPPLREVVRHIDLSARARPWAPAQDDPAWW